MQPFIQNIFCYSAKLATTRDKPILYLGMSIEHHSNTLNLSLLLHDWHSEMENEQQSNMYGLWVYNSVQQEL
jgi:hypothetical protein